MLLEVRTKEKSDAKEKSDQIEISVNSVNRRRWMIQQKHSLN